MLAAVETSAVLPTCTTCTSSALPCTMAPFPAFAITEGLVVEDGLTRKITLLAAAAPSTRACDKPSRDLRSPRNSSTLPRPYCSPSTELKVRTSQGLAFLGAVLR